MIQLSYFTGVFLVVRPYLQSHCQGHLSRSQFSEKKNGCCTGTRVSETHHLFYRTEVKDNILCLVFLVDFLFILEQTLKIMLYVSCFY